MLRSRVAAESKQTKASYISHDRPRHKLPIAHATAVYCAIDRCHDRMAKRRSAALQIVHHRDMVHRQVLAQANQIDRLTPTPVDEHSRLSVAISSASATSAACNAHGMLTRLRVSLVSHDVPSRLRDAVMLSEGITATESTGSTAPGRYRRQCSAQFVTVRIRQKKRRAQLAQGNRSHCPTDGRSSATGASANGDSRPIDCLLCLQLVAVRRCL